MVRDDVPAGQADQTPLSTPSANVGLRTGRSRRRTTAPAPPSRGAFPAAPGMCTQDGPEGPPLLANKVFTGPEDPASRSVTEPERAETLGERPGMRPRSPEESSIFTYRTSSAPDPAKSRRAARGCVPYRSARGKSGPREAGRFAPSTANSVESASRSRISVSPAPAEVADFPARRPVVLRWHNATATGPEAYRSQPLAFR